MGSAGSTQPYKVGNTKTVRKGSKEYYEVMAKVRGGPSKPTPSSGGARRTKKLNLTPVSEEFGAGGGGLDSEFVIDVLQFEDIPDQNEYDEHEYRYTNCNP